MCKKNQDNLAWYQVFLHFSNTQLVSENEVNSDENAPHGTS